MLSLRVAFSIFILEKEMKKTTEISKMAEEKTRSKDAISSAREVGTY